MSHLAGQQAGCADDAHAHEAERDADVVQPGRTGSGAGLRRCPIGLQSGADFNMVVVHKS